jgi:tRNA 2-thiouridine synthesizing protein A
VLRARKAIQGLAPGAVLHVLATDPGSVRDFQAFCEATGHALEEQSQEGGAFSFRVRKTR